VTQAHSIGVMLAICALTLRPAASQAQSDIPSSHDTLLGAFSPRNHNT